MKRLFLLILFPFVLFAFPVENPYLPSLAQRGFFLSDQLFFQIRTGAEYTHFFDQELKLCKKVRKEGYGLDKTIGFSQTASLTLGLKERVDVTFIGGVEKLSSNVFFHEEKNSLKGKLGTTLQGSGKVLLFERKNTSFGVGGKWGIFYSDIQKEKTKWSFQEWQVTIGISQKIKWFYPYLGVFYRNVSGKIKDLSFSSHSSFDFHQKHRKGLFLGFSLSPIPSFFLDLGGQLLGEKSLSVSAEVRF